ncbi:MAG: D-alanyl-D-alanine carboxypeptidase [Oscillospiraceae bacterium]|nr:D-alanyl-D-alanine carboxypeptidase [Oscillospiraceae bacterium]
MKHILSSIVFFISVLLFLPFDAKAVSLEGISAESYVLIEANSGNIIASHNETQKRPMASTTKIMTTLLLLESGNLEEEFKVDNEAIKVEGSSMGLCEDDIVTKLALCYGMMLPSGNDAANQTAVLLAENTNGFAELMNKRAAEIGLKNTNFVTPSGLHDENHYSTAFDMAMLTREALKNNLFKKICSTEQAKTYFGNPPYERWLTNTNKLLYLYEHCIGVKTGFTDEAGRCLVSAAEKDGVFLICVTLNAPNDWNDHIKLYEYGFSVSESVNIDLDYSKLSASVVGGTKKQIAIAPLEEPMYTRIDGNSTTISYEIILDKFIYAPVEAKKKVGKIIFYSNDKMIFSTDLITQEKCEALRFEYKPSLLEKLFNYIKELFK